MFYRAGCVSCQPVGPLNYAAHLIQSDNIGPPPFMRSTDPAVVPPAATEANRKCPTRTTSTPPEKSCPATSHGARSTADQRDRPNNAEPTTHEPLAKRGFPAAKIGSPTADKKDYRSLAVVSQDRWWKKCSRPAGTTCRPQLFEHLLMLRSARLQPAPDATAATSTFRLRLIKSNRWGTSADAVRFQVAQCTETAHFADRMPLRTSLLRRRMGSFCTTASVNGTQTTGRSALGTR